MIHCLNCQPAEDQDSEDEEDLTQVEARRSSHSAASSSGQVPGTGSSVAPATTRLRTRAFAAACLLKLPNLVATDTRHLDPLAAQVNEVKLPSAAHWRAGPPFPQASGT